MESEIYSNYVKVFGPIWGTMLAIITVLLWKFLVNPSLKRRAKTYVTWQDMKERLDKDVAETRELRTEVIAVKSIIDSIVQDRLLDNRRFDSMQRDQERLERNDAEKSYLIREINENLKTSNRLQGQIKDFLEGRAIQQ